MFDMVHLKGKDDTCSNILICGGSGTIGRAIAHEFAQQGWGVGIHYHHNRSSAVEAITEMKTSNENIRMYQADVRSSSEVERLFQDFLEDYGALDLLVWAVGVAPSTLLAKTTPDEWEHTLQTNLTGAFHVLREAGPIFQRQRNGAVIVIGSLSGEQGMTGQTSYASSKAGLLSLMQTAAQEWGSWNIRVNAIFPGWHSSPLSATGMDSTFGQQTHILKSTPSLKQVTASVFHLAVSPNISGQVWNLDSRLW